MFKGVLKYFFRYFRKYLLKLETVSTRNADLVSVFSCSIQYFLSYNVVQRILSFLALKNFFPPLCEAEVLKCREKRKRKPKSGLYSVSVRECWGVMGHIEKSWVLSCQLEQMVTV